RFIELMPMLKYEDFDKAAFVSSELVLSKLEGLVPQPHRGGVARLYKLPGALGDIGLISPVTRDFCSECNRIRLTADGMLKPCLHSRDEICIKGMDREAMKEKIMEAIMCKPRSHGKLSEEALSEAGRSMNRIGG
ncbi:MAG: GTP 3',8-cyclase MoaA, partial [Lachnospiraceae bacterium]|nr:GTP 3',8-cyclase MoaA [Lachnospiraceae bacterium]